jgi:hypothetical protein
MLATEKAPTAIQLGGSGSPLMIELGIELFDGHVTQPVGISNVSWASPILPSG